MNINELPARRLPPSYPLDSPSRAAWHPIADPPEVTVVERSPDEPLPPLWVRLGNARRVFLAIWRSEKPKRRWALLELRLLWGEAVRQVWSWLRRRSWILATVVLLPIVLGFAYYTFNADVASWLEQMDHIGSILGGFAVTAAALRYLLSRNATRRMEQWRAWEVISAAQGKPGNGGRLDAVAALANDGVALDGVNLDGAHLAGIRLPEGASLRSAKLRPVDGIVTILSGAVASGVNLDAAELPGATLEDANLEQASLARTDLRRANMRRARLADAVLQEADLSECDLTAADLRRVRATSASFCSADLFRTNCSGALFGGADLERATLGSASLTHVDLGGAKCRKADFSNADLRWTTLDNADLENAVLFGAVMNGAAFRRARLHHANLRKGRLEGADLSYALLPGACLEDATWDSSTRVAGANILGIEWSEPFREWALANGAIERHDAPDYMSPVVGYAHRSAVFSAIDAHLRQGQQEAPTRTSVPLSSQPTQVFLVGDDRFDRTQVEQWATNLDRVTLRYEIIREGNDGVRITLSQR